MIVLDRNMPGTSGIAVLQRLRSKEVGAERTPEIVFSADATIEARAEAMDAGADLYLEKPMPFDRLLAAVASLGGRKALRENSAREPLLQLAAGSLFRELGARRSRRE